MRTALLFLTFAVGLAAAFCPEGTEPVNTNQVKRARTIGIQAFQSRASEQACSKYPLFIESAGLKKWLVDILPTCTNGKNLYYYNPAAKLPCKGDATDLGIMSVNTNPKGAKSFVKVDKVWSGTTITKDWRQFQPISCPAGFTKASKSQLNKYLKPFLDDYITNQKLIRDVFKAAGFPYCNVGFTKLDIRPLSGCLTYQRRSSKDLMGSAVFTYKCWGSKKTRTLGIIASGVYRLEKQWDVTLTFDF